MSTSKKQTEPSNDVWKWALVAVATTVAIAINIMNKTMAPSIQTIVWIVWGAISIGVFSLTAMGKELVVFFKDAKVELIKVVWPSRQETVQMTVIIMVVVLVVSLMLWAIDSSLLWLVGKLTSLK